jgi:hypothetical protein
MPNLYRDIGDANAELRVNQHLRWFVSHCWKPDRTPRCFPEVKVYWNENWFWFDTKKNSTRVDNWYAIVSWLLFPSIVAQTHKWASPLVKERGRSILGGASRGTRDPWSQRGAIEAYGLWVRPLSFFCSSNRAIGCDQNDSFCSTLHRWRHHCL